MAVARDCDLGLSTSFALESPGSQGLAIPAVTIPLRKTTPRGRAQDFDAHKLHCGAGVRVDLAIQRDLFKLRLGPLHVSPLGIKQLQFRLAYLDWGFPAREIVGPPARFSPCH